MRRHSLASRSFLGSKCFRQPIVFSISLYPQQTPSKTNPLCTFNRFPPLFSFSSASTRSPIPPNLPSVSNKHTGTQIKYASPLLTAASLLSLLLSGIGDLHSFGLIGLIFEGSGFLDLALHNGLSQSHEGIIDILVGLSRGLSEGDSESLGQFSTLFSGHGLEMTSGQGRLLSGPQDRIYYRSESY